MFICCLMCCDTRPDMEKAMQSCYLMQCLFSGGFAYVYVAQDLSNGKTFALKVHINSVYQ